MELLTIYQHSEIVLGSLYFFFIYLIGSYIINGELNLFNIIITTGLFIIWLLTVKIFTNYIVFIQKN